MQVTLYVRLLMFSLLVFVVSVIVMWFRLKNGPLDPGTRTIEVWVVHDCKPHAWGSTEHGDPGAPHSCNCSPPPGNPLVPVQFTLLCW